MSKPDSSRATEAGLPQMARPTTRPLAHTSGQKQAGGTNAPVTLRPALSTKRLRANFPASLIACATPLSQTGFVTETLRPRHSNFTLSRKDGCPAHQVFTHAWRALL
ncbi:MAG TPA: hypothetical protein VGC89_07115 [Pyrinomonadaceae bacterium]